MHIEITPFGNLLFWGFFRGIVILDGINFHEGTISMVIALFGDECFNGDHCSTDWFAFQGHTSSSNK